MKNKKPAIAKTEITKRVWSDWQYFVSFGFGSGLAPKAPGTFGTLAALPMYYLICDLPAIWYLLVCVVSFFVGVKIVDNVSKDLAVDDYPGIVWDEVVGYLFVMYLVPASIFNAFLAFVFFRVFDIWKPFPIRWFDRRLKSGFGVMLDDFIAAVFAWVALQIAIRIIQL